MLQVFATANPQAESVKYITPDKEPINKAAWLGNDLIAVGLKSGKFQVWDTRINPSDGRPVSVLSLSDKGEAVMDIEVNHIAADRASALVTCGRKVPYSPLSPLPIHLFISPPTRDDEDDDDVNHYK